jgi:hypothetical protein
MSTFAVPKIEMAPRLEIKKEVTKAAKAERSLPAAAPEAAGAAEGKVSASAWAGLLEAVKGDWKPQCERRHASAPHTIHVHTFSYPSNYCQCGWAL